MSGHATAESLSLYLDAALPAAERRQVADHLDTCPDCRQRLDGLRRVVAGLGRLPTAAPPEDLAARVGREINLRGRRQRGPGRLEGRLQPRPHKASEACLVELCSVVLLTRWDRSLPTRELEPW